MQIKPHIMCFYKKNFYFSKMRSCFHHISFIPLVFLIAFLFIIPFSVFASSYPSIKKLPEGPGDDNYAYNSFEEFKHNINYGSPADLEDQNFSLSSDMMGVSGPLSFNFTWSDDYGFILNTQFASMINPKNAYAIEADLGFKMNRLNLTLGHAFSKTNRLKLTVERLAQKQNFDFDSGSIDQWVSQYAGGGEFQHILGGGFFNNISIGGYYAQALSKTLDPILYYIDDTAWVNYRHIAGATSKGVNTGIGFRPWKTGIITLTGYYDWVHYRNLYDDVSADDSQEFGYGISLSQYISSSLQATANYVQRAVYKSVEVGISFCHNIFHDTRAFALSLSGARSSSDNVPSDHSITLGFNYYFAPMNNTYKIPGFQMQSLKSWTAQPAVRMEQVLAAADQMSEKAQVTSNVTDVFKYDQLIVGGTIEEKISWHDITTNVPGGQLEYYLTLDKEDTSLGSTQRLFESKPIHGNTYTVSDLDANTKYNITLIAKEETTNVSNPYYGSFPTGADAINWPDEGFKPTLIDLIKQDNGAIRAKLTFAIPYSTLGSTMFYQIDMKEKGNSQSIFNGKDLTDSDVESGIAINKDLYPSKTYIVTVTPSDAAHTVAATQSGEVDVKQGTMTWSKTGLNFIKNKSDSTKGTLQWSEAFPSVTNDKISYNVSITGGSNKIDPYSCDDATKLCSASVSKLSSNTKTYEASITASDTYDKGQTQTLPFSTEKGMMNWTVQGVEFHATSSKDPTQGGEVSWNAAQPSDTSDKVTYEITVESAKGITIVDHQPSDDDGTKTTYTITNKAHMLPNQTYYVTLKATDSVDKPQTKGLDNSLSFPTIKGTMSWSISGVSFKADNENDSTQGGSLSWAAAAPSILSDQMTYTLKIISTDGTVIAEEGTPSDNYGTETQYTIPANLLSRNQKYNVWVMANDSYDTSETNGGSSSAFPFSTVGGTMHWDNFSASIIDDSDHRTLGWTAAQPSEKGAAITYHLTIKYTNDKGLQTLVDKDLPETNTQSPSYTLTDDYFLPDVAYSITLTAKDDCDSNTPEQTTSKNIIYTLGWKWMSSATVTVKPVGMSEKDYTITIDPSVAISPDDVGTIKYKYAVYKSNNPDPKVDPTSDTPAEEKGSQGYYPDDYDGPLSYKVTHDLPSTYYKVRITAYVNGFEKSGNTYLRDKQDVSEEGVATY